ncbi:thiamine pyrophosphate-binding protein [Murimonas intestini]|uniref:Acetolactate synthase-1/2/3 large subunit n=1 Tax=Murimonas intestini TaxID=1337051 RepID=A0AB73T966_9FIRM|nr:thiamine pyrophosphate-binding protein [Murimonas intestini]MCR1839486.1 thiamine pyrophosphate-binding protein [Murimonas intestini]MCR1867971.1 thiamine pyrophosphate-binding protein [Murimonas intestini]MCR1882391.1 thiamine pyrophosphate-binding protein [Murimonas intestini]
MKQKISDYIAHFLANHGIRHVFTVTGGGAMHLNDALGHHKQLDCIYNHHEQACAIAAEGYTRFSGKLAAVCVTSGPGGTNAVTGVLGGWLDSIPMFILSGQVKRETTIWATDLPLRQLGDQEFNIVDCVKPMTKYACMITDPSSIRYHLEKAFHLACTGRGGPVWLDIPLDIQASLIETEDLEGFDASELNRQEQPAYNPALTQEILKRIETAERPVILAGTGIRLAGAHQEFLKCIEHLNIPVVTAWNAHDVLWNSHSLNCGRPGTVGTRGGNFIVQNCDLLLVLGCRMNIRMVSYNYQDFARDAYKIIVDIDENELKKPTVHPDLPVHADVKDVVEALSNGTYTYNSNQRGWLEWCQYINKKYPAALPEYYKLGKPLNPYAFINELCKELNEKDVVITGNGSACVVTFQAAVIKKGQRYFTNSGCAAMGYGFPAAIGGCIAHENRRTVCIDGDGSFQMNLQELQTVVYNHLNIKIFYLNNNGYHSIRQTQTNLFKPPLVGVCDGNGLSFPDVKKLAYAYGIRYVRIDSLKDIGQKIQEVLDGEDACFCEVVLDPNQSFSPKLSSKVLPDGRIISPPIDDMYPFLAREEYEKNKEMVVE